MPEAAKCPVCNTQVKLTVFGMIPKHGNKAACTGTGYTLKEAAALVLCTTPARARGGQDVRR